MIFLKSMKKRNLLLAIVSLFVATAILSCHGNGEEKSLSYEEESLSQTESRVFDNPIDSIVYTTRGQHRVVSVYLYLVEHPDFINNSDSYRRDTIGSSFLWKDCGEIRVYAIPYNEMYEYNADYIVQYKNDGRYDCVSLEDLSGVMKDLRTIKGQDGTVYYVFISQLGVCRQGVHVQGYISAYSIKDSCLVKEKLFRTSKEQYDRIEVTCGGELPLDHDRLCLITFNTTNDSDKEVSFVVTELNDNYWPTGYGFKYRWNGSYFDYVGKCHYNANDLGTW